MLNRQKTLSTIFYTVDAKNRLKNSSFHCKESLGVDRYSSTSTTAKKLSELTRKTFDSFSTRAKGSSSEKLKKGSRKPKFNDEVGKPDRKAFQKDKDVLLFDHLDESNKILISRPTTVFNLNEAMTTLKNLESEQIMLEQNLTHQRKHNLIRRHALDTKRMMYLSNIVRFESFVQELTRRFQKAKDQTTRVRLEMFSMELQKHELEAESHNIKLQSVRRSFQVLADEVVKEFIAHACVLSININQPAAFLARYDALKMNYGMQVKRYDELTSLQEEMQTELANVESQGQNELANLRQQSDELKTRLFQLRNDVTNEQHHQELQDEIDAQEETNYRTSRDAIRNMVYTLMQFRSYSHDRMGKANTLYRQLEELGQVIIFYQDIYKAYQETLQASQQRPKKHGVVSTTSKLDASRSSYDSENTETQNGSSLPGTARPSRVD